MRIAIISTPFIRVPPSGYGGTELFCYELAEGLTARGHEVTLYATGDSVVSGRRRALYPTACWPPALEDEANHAAWAISEIAREGGFDVLHLSSPVGILFIRSVRVPVVHTIHHARCDERSRIYARFPEIMYVAISERQRSLEIDLPRSCVIHHGVSPSRYPPSLGDEGYLAHIGRFAPEKGTHTAVDVAEAAGLPIKLAGRAHPQDHAYYADEVVPRLRRGGGLELGEVDHDRKISLLRGARGLLCPLEWEEPFGLIAIEAMLCGTPVLGFARGSFPEIVDEGVTGFLAGPGDVERLIAAARGLAHFDRAACARRARERFSAAAMVAKYEALYRTVTALPDGNRRRAA
ncbi:glycosyl transferase [Sorangium cellulosum]|uniref:Glycosyl transferase n=1 Tax=Sorangium cellulosum TaxID=56 RepID=A0A4P2Q7C5_SORCE|nr:glycosyltransferase family 4 protein [Sorangium cellulosum]AUX25395.1 glycosyl transferase [Sorangium cellulosum]